MNARFQRASLCSSPSRSPSALIETARHPPFGVGLQNYCQISSPQGVAPMFGLSRLLELAGKVTWTLGNRRSRRSLVPAKTPRRPFRLEELEDRVVPSL